MLEERANKRRKTSDDNSSSSSAAVPAIDLCCEVFLSSGADTVNGFTSCLLTYLVDVGQVYALNGINELRIGKETEFKLRKAIHHSRILIPVLSKGYLSDEGCLIELYEMVESMKTTGQTVSPIFYDVHRGFLKSQTSDFNEAFLPGKKFIDEKTVQIWKQTLKEVAELNGWELENDADGHEGKLIQRIVSDVSEELKRQYLALNLNVTNNLVGLDHHVHEMTRLLDLSQTDVRIVGICGPSGIGKTTIARTLYNQVSRLFDHCIFLEDIQKEHEGLDRLQTELLFNFLKQERQDSNSVSGGINFLKCKFKNRKVLIVLDDVDQRSQVKAVAGNCGWLGAGSRIIVTTRKKYVLPSDEVAWIYEPNELDCNESLQLFSKHAFQRNHPPRDYYDRSLAITSNLAGSPLTLKIVGSFLFGQSKAVWDHTKETLSQSLNLEAKQKFVKEKLKSNYDALDYEQQQIFLDIACLFSGVDKRIAHYMWDDCDFYPGNGIEFLRALSLLNIENDNLLRMDVQMRDLGREVVWPEGKRLMRPTRLWPDEKPLNTMLPRTLLHFRNEPWKLRYLYLDNANLDDEFKYFFPNLRWLCWLRWNYCPPEFSWTGFHVQNLVILDLSWSKISDDWDGWNHIKVARKLKVLNLTGCSCLTTTLNFSDSAFPELERLIIEDCEKLARIDASIKDLKSLVYLSVKNCAELTELPSLNEALKEIVLDGTSVQSILPIAQLKNLQILLANHCVSLGMIELSDSIGLLVNLQSLSLNYCSSLMKLPNSIGGQALAELNLVAAGVTNLPEDIKRLSHLRVLNLGSSSIRMLPTEIGMLNKLEHLNVSYCTYFEGNLPVSIEKLCCLRILNLSGTQINNLSTSIGKLSSLQILDLGWDNKISGRKGITELPDSIRLLVDLQYLSVSNQRLLPKSIWDLESLVELSLEKIEKVELPETVAHLRNLRKLSIRDCEDVQLPVQLKLPCSLTSLTLHCTASSPESIGSLPNLRRLCLFSSICSKMLKVPKSISNCSKLEELTLKGFDINSLPKPPSLLELRLENCLFVKPLADLSNLEKLEHLGIENCEAVNEIEGIDKLEPLRVLRVIGCMSLKVLPDLSKCRMLQELNLRNCENLQAIKGLESLVSLEELDISFCKSLDSMPKVSNLNMLKVFKTKGLEALKSSEESTRSEASSSFPTKTVIAAASSRAAEYEHEVFLSFLGKDTRKNFTDHLCNYLEDLRIVTFRGNEALYVGEQIGPALMATIERSKILIPVLSKNYASSIWCLMELTHMVKCVETTNQIILPVFYDVTPSEVKHQTGAFAKHFLRHTKKFDRGIVQEWKQAFKKVAQLRGWERDKIANGYEAELVKIICTGVLTKLKKTHVEVTEHLVGMDQHEAKLMQLLDLDCSDVKIVGIVGMGGIGKTTIAKFIYNKLCDDQFHQRCSFLEDIREKVKRSGGLDDLKKKLISDILNRTSDGVQLNQSTLKNTKALIVLDDVDDISQLKGIIGKCDWFGHGSRIIVTTRNRDTLRELEGEMIFEPGVMNSENALSLFCKHAFRQDCPSEGYEDLSKKIVSNVAGLPLSLVVLGSLLSMKKKEVWYDTLKMLGRIIPTQIQDRLQISYDMLDDCQQQIFLDIACHFNDPMETEDKVVAASYMWQDYEFFPVSGIDCLVTLSLVKIDENGRFRMNGQLRDLGREIVRKENPRDPGDRSRLWSPGEALDALTNKRGTWRVETLALEDFRNSPTLGRLSNEMFQTLSGLRYLHLSAMYNLTGDFKGIFSNLRWFRWRIRSPITQITNFRLSRLVVLDLSGSNISDDWEDWIQIKMAKNLRLLDLSWCINLTKTPDLSAHSKLERLNLERCSNLSELSPSIGHLRHLNYLNLNYCYKCSEEVLDSTSFESKLKLPEFIWNLKPLVELHMEDLRVTELSKAIENLANLRILNVEGTGIKKFPNAIGMLENLEKLDASRCQSLEELSESVENLRSLRRLHMRNSGVKRLPSEIGRLEKLGELDASGCDSLEELPESVGNLQSLRRLFICNSGVKRFPSDIGRLEKLDVLDASGCQSLEEIPESIGNLRSLRRLNIRSSGVKRLPSEIGRLENLEELDASWCKSLEELPESVGTLRSLRGLRIRNSGLKRLPREIGRLENLEELDASWCNLLEGIPKSVGHLRTLRRLTICSSGVKRLPSEIGRLEKLEELDASECYLLEEIPESVGNLHSLRRLLIRKSGVKRLPNEIGMLKNLEELDASGCKSLEEIPESIGNLQSLRRLNIRNSDVKRLPIEIGRLEKLEVLDASWCSKLEGLPESIGYLRCLRRLTICSSGVNWLPSEIGGLEKLEELDASGCKSLEEIPESIGNLHSLRWLNIRNSGVKRLPIEIERLEKLEELDASGCDSLEELLESLRSLPSLRRLKICNSDVKRLPIEIGRLEKLEVLDVSWCSKLEGLPESIGYLRCLRRLTICSSGVNWLPSEIGGLEKLEELDASGCKSLEEIPESIGNLHSLRRLNIRNSGVKRLPIEIERLEKLEELDASGCDSLEELPESLRSLPSLRRPHIRKSGVKRLSS